MPHEIHTPPVETVETQQKKEIGSDGKIVDNTVVIVVNGIQTIVSIKGISSKKTVTAKG